MRLALARLHEGVSPGLPPGHGVRCTALRHRANGVECGGRGGAGCSMHGCSLGPVPLPATRQPVHCGSKQNPCRIPFTMWCSGPSWCTWKLVDRSTPPPVCFSRQSTLTQALVPGPHVRRCFLGVQGHNASWLRNIAQNESVTISTPFQCPTAQTSQPGQRATSTTASYQAPGNSTAVHFVCSVTSPAPICSNLQICPAGGLQTLESSQVSSLGPSLHQLPSKCHQL